MNLEPQGACGQRASPRGRALQAHNWLEHVRPKARLLDREGVVSGRRRVSTAWTSIAEQVIQSASLLTLRQRCKDQTQRLQYLARAVTPSLRVDLIDF